MSRILHSELKSWVNILIACEWLGLSQLHHNVVHRTIKYSGVSVDNLTMKFLQVVCYLLADYHIV